MPFWEVHAVMLVAYLQQTLLPLLGVKRHHMHPTLAGHGSWRQLHGIWQAQLLL